MLKLLKKPFLASPLVSEEGTAKGKQLQYTSLGKAD